jgi:hypothetical protein
MRIGHPIEHRSKCHAFEQILSAMSKKRIKVDLIYKASILGSHLIRMNERKKSY